MDPDPQIGWLQYFEYSPWILCLRFASPWMSIERNLKYHNFNIRDVSYLEKYLKQKWFRRGFVFFQRKTLQTMSRIELSYWLMLSFKLIPFDWVLKKLTWNAKFLMKEKNFCDKISRWYRYEIRLCVFLASALTCWTSVLIAGPGDGWGFYWCWPIKTG